MLFPMQQEKYTQHQQLEKGQAGHRWTANTPCLAQGRLCPAGDAWEGQGQGEGQWEPTFAEQCPTKFSSFTFCVSRGGRPTGELMLLMPEGGLGKSISMWELLGTTETWLKLI